MTRYRIPDAILDFMRQYWGRTGITPSLSEIARELDLPHSTVTSAFRLLERNGELERCGSGRRALRVVAAPDMDGRLTPNDRAKSIPLRDQGTSGLTAWLLLSNELFPRAVSAVRVGNDSLPEHEIGPGDVIVLEAGAADAGEPYFAGAQPNEFLAERPEPGPSYGRRVLAVIKYNRKINPNRN